MGGHEVRQAQGRGLLAAALLALMPAVGESISSPWWIPRSSWLCSRRCLLQVIIALCLQLIRHLSFLIEPYLPDTSITISQQVCG